MTEDYKQKYTHEEIIELAKKSRYGGLFFSDEGPIFYGIDGSFGPYAPVPLPKYIPLGDRKKDC